MPSPGQEQARTEQGASKDGARNEQGSGEEQGGKNLWQSNLRSSPGRDKGTFKVVKGWFEGSIKAGYPRYLYVLYNISMLRMKGTNLIPK